MRSSAEARFPRNPGKKAAGTPGLPDDKAGVSNVAPARPTVSRVEVTDQTEVERAAVGDDGEAQVEVRAQWDHREHVDEFAAVEASG